MKKFTLSISAILLATSAFATASTISTKTTTSVAKQTQSTTVDIKKVSYLIGRNLGEQFKKSIPNIDLTNFNKGVKSALTNEKSEISMKEARAIMQAFQKQMMAKMEKTETKEANNNLKTSNKFEKAISKVTSIKKVAKGVYIQSIKEGKGEQPTAKDTVTVNYKGTIPSEVYLKNPKESLKAIEKGNLIGNQFDSSYSRGKPATFPLTGVVKCWQKALPKMKVGGTAIVYCSPETAYGNRNVPNIGPNQLLSFQIELIKIEKKN